MDENIIGHFFSRLSSIAEIPSFKVDQKQAAQGVIPKRTLIPDPTWYPLQAVSPDASPGQQAIGGFSTPRSFQKVKQWLGRMNNPPPQRNTSHTDEKSATSHWRKIQDQLHKRRPGQINISKTTLPPEKATDAFTRDMLSVCSESQ